MYQGSPTIAKTSAASRKPAAVIETVRRSRHQTGSSTMPGITSAMGPFIRNPKPAPSPATPRHARGEEGESSDPPVTDARNAAQIPSVMQNVSGRSGSDNRASAKHPKHVATMAPASHAVPGGPARPAATYVSSTSPTPESADHRRAAPSDGPVTR